MTRNCNQTQAYSGHGSRGRRGTTLPEVVLSIALTALAVGGMVSGYFFSIDRAEWSARSAAAQVMAAQRLEQTRAAKWDSLATPPVDELVGTNFPVQVAPLCLPSTSAQGVLATNVTSIALVSEDPPLKMIRVDCTWAFLSRGLYTNTITTYRSPDQ